MLSIGSIDYDAKLEIPKSFSKKTAFNLNSVDKYASLDLSWFLDDETKTRLKTIWEKATLGYSMRPSPVSSSSTNDDSYFHYGTEPY